MQPLCYIQIVIHWLPTNKGNRMKTYPTSNALTLLASRDEMTSVVRAYAAEGFSGAAAAFASLLPREYAVNAGKIADNVAMVVYPAESVDYGDSGEDFMVSGSVSYAYDGSDDALLRLARYGRVNLTKMVGPVSRENVWNRAFGLNGTVMLPE